MRSTIFAAAAIVALSAVALTADRADAAGRWRLDFDPGTMVPAIHDGKAHYVLPYSVKNASDDARKPGLRLELRTETDQTFHDRYNAGVFKSAAKRNDTEGYSSTAKLRTSELAAGASSDALANFGRIDPNADKFQVRVYGLWDPVMRDSRGRVWSERRVLVLKFSRTGDEYDRPSDPIRLVSKSEEVEGEPVRLHGD